MQLSIRGKNVVLTKKEIRIITYAFGERLLGSKLFENIFVTINYTANLTKDEWGYCGPIDHENRYHREFEMILNPDICRRNQIKTIAHELSHVRQFSKGYLRHKDNICFTWMGKIINPKRYKYHKIPWEKDANIQENELYEWYKTSLKRRLQ